METPYNGRKTEVNHYVYHMYIPEHVDKNVKASTEYQGMEALRVGRH